MVEALHKSSLERTRALYAKFGALYSSAVGAINNVLEAVRGYGMVVASLDLHQEEWALCQGVHGGHAHQGKAVEAQVSPGAFLHGLLGI